MYRPDLTFRTAASNDWVGIWPIFRAVVETGDTYAYAPDTTEADARDIWMQPGSDRKFTYVAEQHGTIVGTAYLKPNSVGLGDHICNAGWMIDPDSAGQGVGRRFAEHVLDQARDLGFVGMQFNAVVASNTRAVQLWESMGFEIVGTVPDAFRHTTRGPTAAHIMYKAL